jgi:hypothetical protein
MPDDSRRHGPDRAPGEGEELELLPIWHRRHGENLPGTDLERSVAEREDVRKAKRGEKVDVCGPRTDALDSEQKVSRFAEGHRGEAIE